MGEKLNTAEFDKKGRCVRHPAIRLRKKKLFGGWKIIIGHCPECCLDEMRRVRDEIGAEQDEGAQRRERKEKKKKRSDRRKHRHSGADSISEVGSEPGHQHSIDGGRYRGGRHGHHGGQHHPQDGSEATGSTAQNSSMDGNGSVVSEQFIRSQHSLLGGRDYYHQPQQQASPQQPHPHHHLPQQYHDGPHPGHYDPHGHHSPPPPPQQQQQQPQRTMVLSMAFTDPQTGQRGTYTGQVNSINHKPDGKGTVYYANGSIAEGRWMNGMLMEGEGDNNIDDRGRRASDHGNYTQQPENRARSSSRGAGGGMSSSRGDPPHGGSGGGGERKSKKSSKRSSRSSSRQRDRDSGTGSVPPPPPPGGGGGGAPFQGNLDRLGQLGGKPRRVAPRGASASVQSYNSRGSAHDDLPSGSASVQEYGGRYQEPMGAASPIGTWGGIAGGGGGSYNDYKRGGSRGSHTHHGQNPPGYR